ncbi:hypothetical protein LCGC14_2995870 [marine sediment metagenome]|uniref:Uncharacterized protein n=1 Tax=marine sediment metagenome TaxID=412755 RepID=A0A0F8XQ17_9ZZZZ
MSETCNDKGIKVGETCCECGQSVAGGSGHFVNRVPELNSVQVRTEMGRPHPEGDYVCGECENKDDERRSMTGRREVVDGIVVASDRTVYRLSETDILDVAEKRGRKLTEEEMDAVARYLDKGYDPDGDWVTVIEDALDAADDR